METKPLRWATSEGAFLFQVPQDHSLFSNDLAILLSSSLFAISIFLDKGDMKFFGEKLNIIRLNLHPTVSSNFDPNQISEGYVVHSAINQGFSMQSIFLASEISNELSEFEKAFLDSIVLNILNLLAKKKRTASDIPFLRNQHFIEDIEFMLHEIDANYHSLAKSWSLSANSSNFSSRFEFSNVYYNGKIQVKELFYDLGERAIEAFDQLILSKEEKIVLFKIAKSLVGLSSLFSDENNSDGLDQLNFTHTEIIMEGTQSKKLYRLDVRSYVIDDEQYCDITIMG